MRLMTLAALSIANAENARLREALNEIAVEVVEEGHGMTHEMARCRYCGAWRYAQGSPIAHHADCPTDIAQKALKGETDEHRLSRVQD